MIESATDRLIFLSADDFGVTATYQPEVGADIAITGIFDRQHMPIDANEGGVTGFSVAFTCRADDLARLLLGRAVQGDQLVIAGERWMVVEPQADGTGMVVLILRKVSDG